MIPIAASRLRHRRIRCTDGDMRDVTLFPYFKRSGAVPAVLAVDHKNARLLLLRMDRCKVKAGWLGRIRCDVPQSMFDDLTPDGLAMLSRLWHFDPWWMLTVPPFQTHWASLPLQATNCVNLLAAKHRAVYFRRNLSEIRGVLVSDKGESKFKDWDADNLPEPKQISRNARFRQPTISTAQRRGPTWRLDPIWLR